MANNLFYSSVPVSHDNVTVSQHEQQQDPETETAKWNSDIIVLALSCFSISGLSLLFKNVV